MLLEIADTLPVRGAVSQVPALVALQRNQMAVAHRDAWIGRLRGQADEDALSAYLWLAVNCAYQPSAEHAVDQWLTFVPAWRDTPLVALKAATCGIHIDGPSLEHLLERDTRFVEVHYFLSIGPAFTGRIDAAMDHLLQAYDWRHRWPAVTNALGVNYIALDEFDQAIEFFDRTLAIVPHSGDTHLNKAKALAYAGRYTESLEVVDQLLAGNSLIGAARYWRAVNEVELGRNDDAWDDVELADQHLINSEVPKLAGIIAYRRKQLDVSRTKFELSWRRNRIDCETAFYLGIVLGEQGRWERTADVMIETVACFEKAEVTLNEDIASIRASTQSPARQGRQIGKRERQIAANRRMIVTSWYNTAVSYFRMARRDDARRFAEKVARDEQFGDRARELLARMR